MRDGALIGRGRSYVDQERSIGQGKERGSEGRGGEEQGRVLREGAEVEGLSWLIDY